MPQQTRNPALNRLGGPALALLFFFALPSVTLAHSLYIQSSRYQVSEGKSSPLFFCYGHHIPVDDGVRGEKLKSVRVLAPNGQVRQIAVRPETGLHSYMVHYDMPGTYTLRAETNPGYYTVYIDKKGRERHTIKSKAAVAEKAVKIITSLYSKQYTKTYVVCDEPSSPFPALIGLDIELVPTRDISLLAAGETLELQVFYKGSPYTGTGTWDATFSGFSTESEDNYYPKTEVAGDTLRIFIPRPGRWFVRYFIKIDAQGEAAAQYTQMKHTATLVFQIPNAPKRKSDSSH